MEQNATLTLYGAQVSRKDLTNAVYDAEIESLYARTLEARVVLNTETGELHTEWTLAGSNSFTDRIRDGLDVILYRTTDKRGWSPFCDWFRDGLLDSDMDEFVIDALGKDVKWDYREYYLKDLGDEDPEPLWSWIMEDRACQGELDDEVVKRFAVDMMCDFNPEDIVDDIVKEAERNA